MEVESFPFDVQKLTMAFQTKPLSASGANIKINYNGVNAFSSKFVEPGGEWSLVDRTTEIKITKSSLMTVSIWVQRNWQFYFFRIMLVLGLVTITSVAVFLFDNIGDQVDHLNTVMLTAVAYLFVIGDYTPSVAYLTVMDYFIYFSILFVFMQYGHF
jgi:hypothetical protein